MANRSFGLVAETEQSKNSKQEAKTNKGAAGDWERNKSKVGANGKRNTDDKIEKIGNGTRGFLAEAGKNYKANKRDWQENGPGGREGVGDDVECVAEVDKDARDKLSKRKSGDVTVAGKVFGRKVSQQSSNDITDDKRNDAGPVMFFVGDEVLEEKTKADDKENTIGGLERSPDKGKQDGDDEKRFEERGEAFIQMEEFGGLFAGGFDKGKVYLAPVE